MRTSFIVKSLFVPFLTLATFIMPDPLTAVGALDDPDKPEETGLVDWSSDLEATKQKSKTTGRPIFLLFQEIPG